MYILVARCNQKNTSPCKGHLDVICLCNASFDYQIEEFYIDEHLHNIVDKKKINKLTQLNQYRRLPLQNNINKITHYARES